MAASDATLTCEFDLTGLTSATPDYWARWEIGMDVGCALQPEKTLSVAMGNALSVGGAHMDLVQKSTGLGSMNGRVSPM